jgi:hypothetical protein
MRHWVIVVIVAVIAAGVGAAAALYFAYPNQVQLVGGEARSELLSLNAPPGTLTTEANAAFKGRGTAPQPAAAAPGGEAGDWPSYNKTLTTERFSDLSQINTQNVGKLKVLCTYNTNTYSSFETGLIMIEGALIGTTEYDIFSIDPGSCAQNWHTHEDFAAYILPLNRGAAYLDGKLFRGTEDGRVLACDFKTGTRLWETTIADQKKGETVPTAPIGWATPAAFGAALAAPARRTILITGEGSHQLTPQEVSQFHCFGLKPIIFLFNNDGYLIERLLCKDPEIYYNDLAKWHYHKLPEAMGCDGWFTARVTTCGELDAAIKRAETGGTGAYIEVVADRYAASPLAQKLHYSIGTLYAA